MNQEKTPNPLARFKSAAQRIRDMEMRGEEAVAVVQASRELTAEERRDLQKGKRAGDREAAESVKLIDSSWEAVHADPFARQINLRKALIAFGDEPCPDPVRWLKLYFAACATTLKGKNSSERKKALSLFVPGKQERDNVLYFPRVQQHGQMSVSLYRLPIVAAEPDDIPALKALIIQRERLGDLIEIRLQTEFLWDPRDAVWQAALFLEGSAVVNKKQLEIQFESVDGSGAVYRNRQSKEGYRFFELSPEEIFLLRDNDNKAEVIIEGLHRLKRIWTEFWNGAEDTFDVEAMVKPALGTYIECVITPTQFLQGEPGLVCIKHDAWKESGQTIPVVLYLQRLPEEYGRAWRWIFANDEAVSLLFDGRAMKYHDWTTVAVPNLIRNVLVHGTCVTPPEETVAE